MPIIANEGELKPKQLPPTGTHPARCIQVIDLGTQSTPFGESHKVRLTWELPTELAVFEEKKGKQPFVVSKEYTLSLYEKANLRHDLESWRGKSFTEDELAGFDISKLLAAPCLLTIVHKPTDKGKTYANVSAISSLPKGMECPQMFNKVVEYSIKDGANDTFKAFPDWLRKKIESSFEWSNPQSGANNQDLDNDSVPF